MRLSNVTGYNYVKVGLESNMTDFISNKTGLSNVINGDGDG